MSQTHTIMTSDGTICVVIDGKHFTVTSSHPSYETIYDMVRDRDIDEEKLGRLLNINEAISNINDGLVRVSLEEEKVWYNDTEFHDASFCERILRLMADGQPVQYLVNFLNNLGKNPEFRSIMETFKFICNQGMPITEDGCFIGYKGVSSNYFDKYSGTINNTPDGRRVDMPRKDVCNNSSVGCSSGLHVGSYDYAQGWAGCGKLLMVKVNPADVVSVPNHCCEKLRCSGYWVIDEITTDGGKPLDCEVYDSKTGQPIVGFATKFSFESNYSESEGRTYGTYQENEYCEYCDELIENCCCDESESCEHCGEYNDDCTCYDGDF